MTTYSRGDVALFDFGYTDGSGRSKLRPVYILSTHEYHCSRGKAIVGAITTNLSLAFPGDWLIHDWREAGLRAPSRALAVLETVDLVRLGTQLGRLSDADLRGLEGEVKRVLGL